MAELDVYDEIDRSDALAGRGEAPNNELAEYSVLVALFDKEGAEWDEYGIKLTAQDFFQAEHRIVFEEMMKVADKGEPLVPNSIAAQISNRFNRNHPAVELATSLNGQVKIGKTDSYVDQVKSDSLKRHLIQALNEAKNEVFSDKDTNPEVLYERCLAKVTEAHQDRLKSDDLEKHSVPFHLSGVLEEVDYALKHGEPRKYLSTGFQNLDELTWGGLRPGHLYVIAGRPGMGKTSLALNLCENVSRNLVEKGGATILFYSLEQPAEEITTKILSIATQIPFGNLKMGHLNPADEQNLENTVGILQELMLNYVVINPDAFTITDLVYSVKQASRAMNGVDLVVVDYIGLMQSPPQRHFMTRSQEIGEITRGMKNLANQQKIPIIALSQINRKPDERASNRPRLSDLRDSGAIEQDADMVMMLYKPTYSDSDPKKPDYNKFELLISKNRHGQANTRINLEFQEQITTFVEKDERPTPIEGVEEDF